MFTVNGEGQDERIPAADTKEEAMHAFSQWWLDQADFHPTKTKDNSPSISNNGRIKLFEMSHRRSATARPMVHLVVIMKECITLIWGRRFVLRTCSMQEPDRQAGLNGLSHVNP